MLQFWHELLSNNTPSAWLKGLGVALLILVVLGILKYSIGRRNIKGIKATAYSGRLFFQALLYRLSWITLLLLAANAARIFITLPEGSPAALAVINRIGLIFQFGLWLDGVIRLLVEIQINRRAQDHEEKSEASVRLIGTIGLVVIWTLVGLLILDNLPNVQISTLIASLGVTGIAVALAVQSILSDLFASITIVIDKPFVSGDFIQVGDKGGTVERVGLRSTRLRTLSGEMLIVSNQKLLDGWVSNFQGLDQRRITLSLRVAYDTGVEKLNRIPDLLQEIFNAFDDVTLERATFNDFGESGLIFEVVYLVTTGDFDTYINLRHQINLDIYQRFDDEGIRFAFPVRSVFIEANEDTAS